MKRLCELFLIVLSLGFAAGGIAAEREEVTRLSKPLPVDTPGKIEVIEFFWYGCPHCNSLESSVDAWEKQLPKDVAFRKEHVVWPGRPDIEAHARLYLTLRAMGLLGQHHRAVFDALHKDKVSLRTEKDVADWAAKRGIDRAKFEATWKSFGVNAQLGRARDLTNRFEADGVPSFGVNGKYYVSLGAVRSEKRVFEVVNKLIADERGAKK